MLVSFYHLESIDFSNVEINEQASRRLLLSLPRKIRSRDLIVIISKESRRFFDEAASKNRVKEVRLQAEVIQTIWLNDAKNLHELLY